MQSSMNDDEDEYVTERMLLTPVEVAELVGVSVRTVLALPIKQIRVGTRTIRYSVREVYAYLGIDNPNL